MRTFAAGADGILRETQGRVIFWKMPCSFCHNRKRLVRLQSVLRDVERPEDHYIYREKLNHYPECGVKLNNPSISKGLES